MKKTEIKELFGCHIVLNFHLKFTAKRAEIYQYQTVTMKCGSRVVIMEKKGQNSDI